MRVLPQALVAIITPFAEDLSVDRRAHIKNVSALAGQGCSGFVIGGSTGEGPYLDDGERQTLVEATRSTEPEAAIVCGINGESVRQAIRQVNEIAQADADIALVATPTTLIRGMHDLVERFYRDVADASPIPILLYSNPSVAAYEIPTDTVNGLSAHPNIIGIKDSGGDPTRFSELAEAIDFGFEVLSGSSRTLLESGRRGATGAVTASGNYAYTLVSAAIAGDADAQTQLSILVSVIESKGRAGTKYAANVAGLEVGRLRPPLVPIDATAREEIDAVLDSRKQTEPE
jgi:4-hydroxy-2-oxoglutarate aldolase